MWCTQGFAKDDTIGRVRWGSKPQVAGMQCPGHQEAVPSPLMFTARLVVSMALFPTCLGTWSLGTLPATVGCHLQTMPTCSAVSGPWLKRVCTGWVVAPGGSRSQEKKGLTSGLPRQCTTPLAASWLPSPQNGID